MTKEFTVSSDIYSDSVIQQAVDDFADVTKILFRNNAIQISWDTEEYIDEVFNELMNYTLSL